MRNSYSHIELFAGCGGMSLGLDSAGFETYFANELSPMASETFAYNLLHENLEKLAESGKEPINTLWINSKYPKNDLKSRLRENPNEAKGGDYTDLNTDVDLKNKLLVGDVNQLLGWLDKNPTAVKKLQEAQINLVSGGPPCQSFSLAGRREKNNAKNLLPLSFAKFVGLVKPQFVLLENVKGIIAPFAEEGHKYYAWLEVSKAFVLEGYVPVCMLLNSKYFGIPQNRPRFILLGLRQDVYARITKRTKNEEAKLILDNSFAFFKKVNEQKDNLDAISNKDLALYDIEADKKFFNGYLLPKIITDKNKFISAETAINDILSAVKSYRLKELDNGYSQKLNSVFPNKNLPIDSILKNHEARKHGNLVKARFRLYQVISGLNGLGKPALDIIEGKVVDYEKMSKVFIAFQKYEFLFHDDKLHPLEDLEMFQEYVEHYSTKKHSQRALKANEPAPAQLTIPDDVCHYSISELRTMTVREMARLQSFPDWFVFRSKITTGGTSRKFEVPQYTQVGNAVPPLLAKALGEVINGLMEEIES